MLGGVGQCFGHDVSEGDDHLAVGEETLSFTIADFSARRARYSQRRRAGYWPSPPTAGAGDLAGRRLARGGRRRRVRAGGPRRTSGRGSIPHRPRTHRTAAARCRQAAPARTVLPPVDFGGPPPRLAPHRPSDTPPTSVAGGLPPACTPPRRGRAPASSSRAAATPTPAPATASRRAGPASSAGASSMPS